MTPSQTTVIALVRKHADKHNYVNVLLEDIAKQLGDGSSAGDVQLALVQLKDQAYFIGKAYCDGIWFNATLPS